MDEWNQLAAISHRFVELKGKKAKQCFPSFFHLYSISKLQILLEQTFAQRGEPPTQNKVKPEYK